jgi:hypothetical protein
MHCPNCHAEVEEGLAVCSQCGAPLTAYGGQITGEVRPETRAKAAKLAVRPPIVVVMAILDALVALLGPLGLAWVRITGRTQVSEDATNYIAAALGAVGAFAVAIVLIPLGLFLLVLAWATWTQKPWAWMANVVLLILMVLLAVRVFAAEPGQALLRIGLCGAIAYFWFHPRTKEWFGLA